MMAAITIYYNLKRLNMIVMFLDRYKLQIEFAKIHVEKDICCAARIGY